MSLYRIKFLPSERTFPIDENETVLESAMRSGIHINASCGGNGACGKCRIKIREGKTHSKVHPKIPQWEYDEGVRLACMTRPAADLVVEVPLESQIDRMALKKRREPSHILAVVDLDRLVKGWSVDPSVFKKYIELPPPSTEDNLNDLARLTRELKKTYQMN